MKDFRIAMDGRGYAVVIKNEQGVWKKLISGFRSAEEAVRFLTVYKPAHAVA